MERVRPLVVGLTGGIASGKSTVASFLEEVGVPVVDADALAREVVAPGTTALEEIRRTFGEGVLRSDGSLDRGRMAALVFSDPEARRRLEAITHPRIAEAAARRIEELGRRGHPIVVYEASLLVELGLHRSMAALIAVSVEPEEQVRRVVARNRVSPDEARRRIAAQAPEHAKVAVADYVIDTSGSLEQTRRRTRLVWERLRRRLLGNGESPSSRDPARPPLSG